MYKRQVVQSGDITYNENYAVPHRMGGINGNFVSNYAYADGALLNGEPETGGTVGDIIGCLLYTSRDRVHYKHTGIHQYHRSADAGNSAIYRNN